MITSSSGTPVILCRDLVRIFTADGIEVQALQGLNLRVDQGELVGIVGESGSGKSTLLTILSGMDAPTAGLATVSGHRLAGMGRRERVRYQRTTVGVVWQQTSRNLLSYLTAAENIAVVLAVGGRSRRRSAATELLDLLGVGDCADLRPVQMSGGQQQRVAIAVALANQPQVLLADEPTGELDEVTSAEVLETIRGVNRELGVTTLIVTHDAAVSDHVRRTIQIRDGRTSTEVLRSNVTATDGAEGPVAQEFTVLDRVGRMQLPAAYVARLDLTDRVRLELETDHVGVWQGDRPVGNPSGEPAAIAQEERFGWSSQDPGARASGPSEDSRPVLSASGLTKIYPAPGGDVVACADIDLEVRAGEFVVLRGRSGAGKTTLLNLLGGLDRPTSGQVLLGGKDLAGLSAADLTALRGTNLGYVFQSFGLLPMLSAAENVEVPLRVQRVDPAERDERVAQALRLVGLAQHSRQRPAELSGGQQQRVGLARAIVSRPRILIADEPTAQLDSVTAAGIIELINDLVVGEGVAAIVSTHQGVVTGRATSLWEIRDGLLTVNPPPAADALR